MFLFILLCLSFSLSLLMPLCICLTLLPSVSLSICLPFHLSFLANALHAMSPFSLPSHFYTHACEYNDYQRIHMELSRSHNSLFITQRQSHTKDTHPHLFLLLPSRLLFCLYAPAPTTHTLPLLLNQQKGGARWRRSITVTGGVRQPAEQPCVALSLPLETTLSVSHSYKLY